jgi:diaminopimelate decarboxylase
MSASDTAKPAHGPDVARSIFAVDGSDLMVGGVAVRSIVEHVGTPTFLYDGGILRASYRALADALDGFAEIHYSVKANPAKAIIALFLSEGAGIEIASIGEYRAAIAAGAAPERILFAGPGKRRRELEEVIADGIGEIHVESHEEIERIEAIAAGLSLRVKISLRINPMAEAQAGAMRMGGKPTAFGFCEEDLDPVFAQLAQCRQLDFVGVHIYGGTQILDAEALLNQWRHGIRIAGDIAARLGRPLETIDLGGGLGIPYYAGETPLDLAAFKAGLPELSALLAADSNLAAARIVVEPGRFLTGPGGIYVAEVNAVKDVRGTLFVITDGGMHHHLAASGNLGQIIKRDYPIVAPARMDEAPSMAATIVGPLCTPLDTLARSALLPALKAGDLIAVLQSGAYGPSASPGNFLSHAPAAEMLVENGEVMIL